MKKKNECRRCFFPWQSNHCMNSLEQHLFGKIVANDHRIRLSCLLFFFLLYLLQKRSKYFTFFVWSTMHKFNVEFEFEVHSLQNCIRGRRKKNSFLLSPVYGVEIINIIFILMQIFVYDAIEAYSHSKTVTKNSNLSFHCFDDINVRQFSFSQLNGSHTCSVSHILLNKIRRQPNEILYIHWSTEKKTSSPSKIICFTVCTVTMCDTQMHGIECRKCVRGWKGENAIPCNLSFPLLLLF